ncbi:DNA polymerase subunit gamma-1, mitochondrial [Diachasma alloeum]|uniref:DNA polymerase subunit gamma-1, mitochondrial n=1 Tax=Diachasma alloeum TaxID=454923 RepID=UPI0007383DEB|nr:DNA polymerase subunit gamma-1, mitochondrial [Diachasma alloeum]
MIFSGISLDFFSTNDKFIILDQPKEIHTRTMRMKINLNNTFIRYKCSDIVNNSGEQYFYPGKKVSKKIIRVKRVTKAVDTSDLTSNITDIKRIRNPGIGLNENVDHDAAKENKLKNSINKFKPKFIPENLNDISLWDDDGIDTNFGAIKINKNEKEYSSEKNDGNVNKKIKQQAQQNNNANSGLKIGTETRFNELNMQMLSKKLHEQIFINSGKSIDLSNEKISFLKHELKRFGMEVDERVYMPDVSIDLPALEGKNVEEHFYSIASAQSKPYLTIIENILQKIPSIPKEWLLQEGWTRYYNGTTEKVDYPLEDGLIFDVEVCVREGSLPTLATAVSTDAWYGWVSKSLVGGSSIPAESRSFTPELLIPIESTIVEHGKKLSDYQKRPKIIVGHNVCYDRARIKEQYWLNSTGTRFVDTMSLHISVSGMNSYQRSILLSRKSEPTSDEFLNSTSLNNLADVYSLYCGKQHQKQARDVFVRGSLIDVREKFDELMNYCASDIVVTHEVLQNLFPLFQERFPHPVTFAGMLELGTAYLPVSSNWQRYIEESEATFEDLNYEAKVSLSKRADEVCKLMHNDKYKEDLWMWDQDWSTQSVKTKTKLAKKALEDMEKQSNQEEAQPSDYEKYLTDDEHEIDPLEAEFSHLKDTKYLLPAKFPHMSGYPAWYRKLCMKQHEENWIVGPQNISTSMKITPKLLNLTWENYPVHYIRDHGWGFLVPYNDHLDVNTQLPLKQLLTQCPLPTRPFGPQDASYAMASLQKDVQNELHKIELWRDKKRKPKKNDGEPEVFYKGTGIWCNVDIDNCCWFFKLPHKDGPSLNVGNPLAKDFLNKFSENILAGLDSSATEVLKIARIVSYWRNNRDRIMSQLVIWWNAESLPLSIIRSHQHTSYGAIIPQVVVSGTLTRRATEPTWMTASNAHIERVGSELRAMVQAPPGFNIVGADVDSQELWIASLIGDAYCAGVHGATPFGWMTLIGSKSKGTDMHSVTAKAVGISRDHAKVINYARIYGAGVKFAERLLKQFNPCMGESEAVSKARKMFSITKGKKMYRLRVQFINDDVEERDYSSWEAYQLAKVHGKKVEEMFGPTKWCGGSESAMFNRLEEIADSLHPVTPFLSSRLSRALEVAEEHKDKYLPTKINWVVQSGAVDFLHLMLVCMKWLMRDNARFCLSFHDEIRYIVPSRYKYNAALGMHVTNLLTRSFCASTLGINDLPMSVAFFASVEVDSVLRKESTIDCKTPSNPHGLENGYGVSPGESLGVWEAVEKSGGSLGPWHMAQMRKKKLEVEQDKVEQF